MQSYDQTNAIVKMKKKKNLFNYQLASNIKTQVSLEAIRWNLCEIYLDL